jgi:hypothetical protein
MSVIPALGRLREKNCDFEGRLGCIERTYLKKFN